MPATISGLQSGEGGGNDYMAVQSIHLVFLMWNIQIKELDMGIHPIQRVGPGQTQVSAHHWLKCRCRNYTANLM